MNQLKTKPTPPPSQIIKEGQDLRPKTQTMEQPDPKLHQYISFIKSGIRIAGYVLLLYNITLAASILIVSEIIGIVEELV